jgi:predicted RNA-binding protein with TRAM domain
MHSAGISVSWINQNLGLAEVSGLQPGETISISILASNGATDSTSTVSGTSLQNGIAPEFGTATPREQGYSVPITNFDPTAHYTVTSGSATIENGILFVTNVASGETQTVTVQVAKTGYAFAESIVSGIAKIAATTTTLPPTVTNPVSPVVVATPTYTIKAGRTALLKSIATRFSVKVASTAKLTGVVVTSSKKLCAVIRSSLKGVKRGSCRLTLIVTPRKGKPIRKTVTVKIS